MASKLIHKKPKRVNINPLMLDPTRTKTLRRQFGQSLSGRLNILSQRVTKLIAEENALGIGITTGYALNTRWMFNTTSEQVSAFIKWFMEQTQELLYSQEENSWWKEYVVRAYNQGAGSAWSKWRDKSRFLQDAFNNPVQIERVKTLAGRVLTELKNVTQAMATTMSRTLTDGLAQGKSPYIVARELNRTVQGIGKTRAEMIARTEVVRAHSEGSLDSLEALGMDQVGVMVEWTVSGLGKTRGKGRGKVTKGGNPSPCHLCAPMKGVVMTIQQARGLLPRHPNCLCGFVPAGVGEDTTGQKIGKKAVSAALAASIKAEIPPTSKKTLAEQRSRTTWAGGTKIINRKVENFNPNHDKEGKFDHAQSATSDFLKSMDTILQTSAKAHADHVYTKMTDVEIGVDRGALVSARDLRKVSGLSKQQFDQAVYDLAKEGRVSAHRHDFAASLPQHELAELVDTSIGDPSRADLPANHGRYWVGIARKQK